MAGVLAFTEKRKKMLDLPSFPTAMTALELMIPKPTIQKRNYVVAVWLPFQTQVQLINNEGQFDSFDPLG